MVIVAESSNREDLALVFLIISYCYMSLKRMQEDCNLCALEILMVSRLACIEETFCIFWGNGWDGDCNFLCSSCMNSCPRRCCIWWLLVPNHHTRRMSTQYHQSQYLNTCARKGLAHRIWVSFWEWDFIQIYKFWTLLSKGWVLPLHCSGDSDTSLTKCTMRIQAT